MFEVTDRAWEAETLDSDDHLAPDGRVMEVLSEHLCQGWLEGYLLTGRHGLFNCYEAFIHIVDSMFNQHAKWLKVTRDDPVAAADRLAQLPALLARLAPGPQRLLPPGPRFIDHVVNKKAEVVRVYLPPDANCLLSVADHCLRSRDYVNVIVAGKQPALNYLTMDEAIAHCTRGHRHLGVGLQRRRRGARRRARLRRRRPDARDARRGGDPARAPPELKVRVVNVVDLMRLEPDSEHPHGLSDAEFDALFTTDRPVIFAYHGYPWLIHRLTYRRTNHDNIHVRGYKEEGTTTTPFDMVMLNDLDRFHLVIDVIDRVPGLGRARRAPAPGDGRRAAAPPRLHARARRRPARDPRLDLAALSDARSRRVRVLVVNAGSSSLKLTLLDGDGRRSLASASSTRRARRSTRQQLRDALDAALRRGRRGRPPDRPRRRALPRGRCAIDDDVERGSCASSSTSRRCTSRSRSPRSTRSREALPELPAVACFDTAFHATLPAGRGDLRAAGARGASAGGCAATASTGSRTPGSRGARRELLGRRPAGCGSSAATSAPAPRCARSRTGARSTRRWASRRSRAS